MRNAGYVNELGDATSAAVARALQRLHWATAGARPRRLQVADHNWRATIARAMAAHLPGDSGLDVVVWGGWRPDAAPAFADRVTISIDLSDAGKPRAAAERVAVLAERVLAPALPDPAASLVTATLRHRGTVPRNAFATKEILDAHS